MPCLGIKVFSTLLFPPQVIARIRVPWYNLITLICILKYLKSTFFLNRDQQEI